MAKQLYKLMGERKVNVLGEQQTTTANALEHVCRFAVDVQKADDLSIDIVELLRERTDGPGEAFFVVTRVQLLLMRIAVQRTRGRMRPRSTTSYRRTLSAASWTNCAVCSATS